MGKGGGFEFNVVGEYRMSLVISRYASRDDSIRRPDRKKLPKRKWSLNLGQGDSLFNQHDGNVVSDGIQKGAVFAD
jgi:hypothetical protein